MAETSKGTTSKIENPKAPNKTPDQISLTSLPSKDQKPSLTKPSMLSRLSFGFFTIWMVLASLVIIFLLGLNILRPSTDQLRAEQAFLAYLLNEDSLTGLSEGQLNQEQRDRLCFAIAHGLIKSPSVYYGFTDDRESFDRVYSAPLFSMGGPAQDYFANTGCSARIPTMPADFSALQQ